MAKQFIFITLLLWANSVFGQSIFNFFRTPPPPPTIKRIKIEERNHDCVKKGKTSFSDRLKNYPFDVSTCIQFVSFVSGIYEQNNIRTKSDSLPRMNDTVVYAKLTEVKTLTFRQVDALSDIFYNYGFRGRITTIGNAACYMPRNAILFLDKNNKVVEFIEICFECDRTKESSLKISLGEMCTQKLDMLKNLFRKVGVEYGTREIK